MWAEQLGNPQGHRVVTAERRPATRGTLSLCVLAKMIYPPRVRDQQQDMETYARLRPWVRRAYLIVSSPGARTRVTHHRNVVGLHVEYGRRPLFGILRFWARGFLIALALTRRRRIDLLMAAEPLVAGPLALAVGRVRGVPVLVHIQGDLFRLPVALVGFLRAALTRWITVQVARRADRVRCVSRALRDACVRAGVARERVVLLPVRCDFERFDPRRWRAQREAARRSLGLAPDDVAILSVGSLTVHKGYEILIDALARLRSSYPVARVVIVGGGPLRESLEARARHAGVADAVRLTGPVPYERVPEMLVAADIYVQPSHDEGIPRAALEAMALELPVVASRVGSIPELVEDGVTGVLVPAGDAEALAAALEPFVADPDKGRDLGARARVAARAEFGIDTGIERYGSLLLEAAGAAAGR